MDARDRMLQPDKGDAAKLDVLYGALRLIMDRCEYETDEAYIIGEQALKEINVL